MIAEFLHPYYINLISDVSKTKIGEQCEKTQTQLSIILENKIK